MYLSKFYVKIVKTDFEKVVAMVIGTSLINTQLSC